MMIDKLLKCSSCSGIASPAIAERSVGAAKLLLFTCMVSEEVRGFATFSVRARIII